ncbi:MAG: diacylglycerol kinase family protein [Verrucomicrobium sp.]
MPETSAPRWTRPVIILNRESGTISNLGPEVVAKRLEEIFTELGAQPDVRLVRGAEIQNTLEDARDGNSDAVIIGGGDGSVATAATVLAGSAKPLGILPLGTFNLAARDVGMNLDWEEAARQLIQAPVAAVDLLDVDGSLFFCVVVLGFYPALAMGQKEYHGNWLVKSWRTGMTAIRDAATFPPLHLILKDDEGKEIHRRSRIALMANNDYEDLFGIIPRRRSLDAGYFTVYISTHQTRWGLLKSSLAWLMGRWKEDKELTVIHTTELQVEVRKKRRIPVMRDGEIDKLRVPFMIRLKPKAVHVLAPRVAEEQAAAAAAKAAAPVAAAA